MAEISNKGKALESELEPQRKKEETKIHKMAPLWRWVLTIVAGILLGNVSNIISGVAASVLAGESGIIFGRFYPMISYSILRVTIFTFGIKYTWRIVNGGWKTIGFDFHNWKQDAYYGSAVAIGLAIIQVFVLLPLTGGSQRSDIIAASEIMGTSLSTLVAAIILGLAGALSEELFFRGHIIRSLQGLLGDHRLTLLVSSVISITLFGLGHSYQGLSGVLNTVLIASIFTVLFLWRGTLTAGIVAHGVYNTLAFLGVYFLYT